MSNFVNGIVTDADEVPVADALVYIFGPDGTLSDLTDALGSVKQNPVATDETGAWDAYTSGEGYHTLVFNYGGRPRFRDITLVGRSPLDRADVAAATAEAITGPTYATSAAGLAAVSEGQAFAVGTGDGIVTIYKKVGGAAVFQRTLATLEVLASTAAGKGASLVKFASGKTVEDLSSTATGKGAALVGFKQAGTGAAPRTLHDRARDTINVKDFGAIGDGVAHTVAEWIIPGVLGRYASLAALQVDYPHVTATTNCLNWAAFQAATNHGMGLGLAGGCEALVPSGQYSIKGVVSQDRSSNSALGSVDFVGAGRRATWIMHTTATALFFAKGHPTEVSKQTTDLRVEGMTLLGSNLPGQIAVSHDLCSDPHYKDLHIEGFDYAWSLQDVDQAVFTACMVQFNKRGLYAQQNASPVANSTQPNQFVFTGCTFMNNSIYGLLGVGGSNWTYLGGVISTNGQSGPTGYGMKIQNGGYQGGNLLTMIGTNFESNNGIADLILENTLASGGLTQATYSLVGCSFNRTSNTIKATNCILTNFASVATVGEQVVTLDACVFKSLGGYTPSGATPYLNWSGAQGRNARNFSAPGTIFEDASEAPSFVQNITKPWIELTRTSTQAIPSGTPTIWQLNSAITGFSWVSSVNGSYQIPIPESGLYNISVEVMFSGALANQTMVEILKGTDTLAVGVATASSVAGKSTQIYLSAGDLISVRVTQNSGSSATLNGSASGALSRLVLYKAVDA